MKLLAALLLGLPLVGCGSWNPYDPTTPETVGGQASADQSRASAQTLCGPTGTVTQRDDTDGSRAGDWKCERPKR